jgi:hypothetical protein
MSWGKKIGFVDSGFVKTCDELVIGRGRRKRRQKREKRSRR